MITLDHVSMRYGEKAVLSDVSFTLEPGGHYALLGPSGCGKTTLLRLIAGLQKPTCGLVHLPKAARMAVCFQEDRLLPWLTVLENILPAAGRGRLADAQRWLSLVGLGSEGDAYPDALSGGMKRRAALARALAADCPILLLDEPFRALDAQAHAGMLALVREHARGRLLLLVTHDEADAEGMHIIRLDPITHKARFADAD